MAKKVKKSKHSKRVIESRKGERSTQSLIAKHCGLRTRYFGGNNPSDFDILVDDSVRVECKDSRKGYGNRWHFVIARHGQLNEECDIYALTLRGIGQRSRVHVLIPAPIGKKGLSMSLRSLVTRYARFIDNWQLISELANKRRAAKTETEQILEAA